MRSLQKDNKYMHTWMIRSIRFMYHLLLFTLPLLMTNQTSEMFEFPKMIFIYGVASTVLFFWLIDVAFHPRRIVIHLPLIAVLAFLGVQALATIFSVDIHTSVFGYYGRFNGGLLSTISYVILFFVALQVFDKASFQKLFLTSIISSIVVLAWGFPGRILGFDLSCVLFRGDFSTSCWTNEFRPQERMFSTLGQPNWLGSYFVVHIFLMMFLLLRKHLFTILQSKQQKHILLVAGVLYMLCMSWGVHATGSRSSQIGLMVGIVIVGLAYVRTKWPPYIFRTTLIVLCVVLLGSSVWYVGKVSRTKSQSITHSGTIRLIVWEGALRLAARYPLLGTGPETFAYTYYLTRPVAHNNTTERDFIYNKAHNEFLHILATSGILGLLAYVFMLYTWGKKLLNDKEDVVLGASLLALCVINFFGFSTSTSQVLLFILPLYTLLEDKHDGRQVSTKHTRWSFVVISILLIVWIYSVSYIRAYVQADMAYARALQYQYEGSIDAMQEFNKALGYRFEHVYASKFALTATQTAYALSQVSETANEYAQQTKTLSQIAVAMQDNAIKGSPHNPLYWKERVRVFTILSQLVPKQEKAAYVSQAEVALQKAAKLAPTDMEIQELQDLVKE